MHFVRTNKVAAQLVKYRLMNKPIKLSKKGLSFKVIFQFLSLFRAKVFQGTRFVSKKPDR